MLSLMAPDELRRIGLMMRECGGMPSATRLQEIITRAEHQRLPDTEVIVNRMNGRTVILKGSAAELFDLCHKHNVDLRLLREQAPALFDRLAFFTEHPSEKVAV